VQKFNHSDTEDREFQHQHLNTLVCLPIDFIIAR